jgi:hypothetical protein
MNNVMRRAMLQMNSKRIKTGEVLFAPEGFVDKRYAPALKIKHLRVLEMRVLADGPVFQLVDMSTGKHHS